MIFSKFVSRKKAQITDRPVQNRIPGNHSQNNTNISALGTVKVADLWQHLTGSRLRIGCGKLQGEICTTNLIQFVSVILYLPLNGQYQSTYSLNWGCNNDTSNFIHM